VFIIFFNLRGIGMLAGSVLLVAILGPLLKPIGIDARYPNSLYFLAASVLVIDLAYRYFRLRPRLEVSSQNWLTSRMGGSLMLMPAWACSVLGFILWAVFGER